jgi:hypothetical protein
VAVACGNGYYCGLGFFSITHEAAALFFLKSEINQNCESTETESLSYLMNGPTYCM